MGACWQIAVVPTVVPSVAGPTDDPGMTGFRWGTAAIRRWRDTVATAYDYTVQVTGARAVCSCRKLPK
jgi:hypothetical protein